MPQAKGLINSSIVTSMDEATQQNAALAEQASAASHSMSDKARELQQMVSQFKVA